MNELNALAQLRDNELCEILVDGCWREVVWSLTERRFRSVGGIEPKTFGLDRIDEWRPASVKF